MAGHPDFVKETMQLIYDCRHLLRQIACVHCEELLWRVRNPNGHAAARRSAGRDAVCGRRNLVVWELYDSDQFVVLKLKLKLEKRCILCEDLCLDQEPIISQPRTLMLFHVTRDLALVCPQSDSDVARATRPGPPHSSKPNWAP